MIYVACYINVTVHTCTLHGIVCSLYVVRGALRIVRYVAYRDMCYSARYIVHAYCFMSYDMC